MSGTSMAIGLKETLHNLKGTVIDSTINTRLSIAELKSKDTATLDLEIPGRTMCLPKFCNICLTGSEYRIYIDIDNMVQEIRDKIDYTVHDLVKEVATVTAREFSIATVVALNFNK